MSMKRKQQFEFAGWAVFVLSAICYTWAGIKAGDPLSITGSLLFLGACFLFLAPGFRQATRATEEAACESGTG